MKEQAFNQSKSALCKYLKGNTTKYVHTHKLTYRLE